MARRNNVVANAASAREAAKKAPEETAPGLTIEEMEEILEEAADSQEPPKKLEYDTTVQRLANRNIKALAVLEGLEDQSSVSEFLGITPAMLSVRYHYKSTWTLAELSYAAEQFGVMTSDLLSEDVRALVRIWSEQIS